MEQPIFVTIITENTSTVVSIVNSLAQTMAGDEEMIEQTAMEIMAGEFDVHVDTIKRQVIDFIIDDESYRLEQEGV